MPLTRDPQAVAAFVKRLLTHGAWTLAPQGNDYPFFVHPTNDESGLQVGICISDADLATLATPELSPDGSALVGYHWPAAGIAGLFAQIAHNGAETIGLDGSVIVACDTDAVLNGLNEAGLVAPPDGVDPDGHVAVTFTANGTPTITPAIPV